MIPPIAHFIWVGTAFPWIFTLAIKSAAARGCLDRVIFHHTDDLGHLSWWQDLSALPGVECRRFDPIEVLESTGPRAGELIDRYREIRDAVARTNVLRAALLWRHGGVYLDADTLTVADLSPLLAAGVFCGEEHIVYPQAVKYSRTWRRRLKTVALSKFRELLQLCPHGYRIFHYVKSLYPRAVNGAVLGGQPAHPLFRELLARTIDIPRELAQHRHALGTHLLQQVVKGYPSADLKIHSAEVFYPLPPVISLHWFRPTRFLALSRIIKPTTRVVHWYASVRTARIIEEASPDWIRANAKSQLFSALALPFLE
jgi:hypothetical protein